MTSGWAVRLPLAICECAGSIDCSEGDTGEERLYTHRILDTAVPKYSNLSLVNPGFLIYAMKQFKEKDERDTVCIRRPLLVGPTSSPWLHTVPVDNATYIAIPLPFQDAPYEMASRGWIACTEILVRVLVATEPGGEKAGRDTPYLDTVFLEHAVPL